MKTVRQALIDEIHYPISEGFVENKLYSRGIDPDDELTIDVLKSNEFKGAVADCLWSLIEAPNFSEADKSISLADRNVILRKVNSLYLSIGESAVDLADKPSVFIL